jgi:hypothetical protein
VRQTSEENRTQAAYAGASSGAIASGSQNVPLRRSEGQHQNLKRKSVAAVAVAGSSSCSNANAAGAVHVEQIDIMNENDSSRDSNSNSATSSSGSGAIDIPIIPKSTQIDLHCNEGSEDLTKVRLKAEQRVYVRCSHHAFTHSMAWNSVKMQMIHSRNGLAFAERFWQFIGIYCHVYIV